MDLAVCSPSELGEVLSVRPRYLLVEGDARGTLRRAGYRVSAYVALPGPRQPRLVAAPEHPGATAYALRTRIVPPTRLRRLRRDVAASLLERRVVPPFVPLITLGLSAEAPPLLVAAAEAELGISNAGWFLVCGAGDALSRGVFVLFAPAAQAPAWALKFSRVRGYDAPFRREEKALRLARAVGPVVQRHAPTPLGRIEIGGFSASLETAAAGHSLDSILAGTTSTTEKAALVERIAEWIVGIAAASRAPVERAGPEWGRLVELAGAGARDVGVAIPLPETPFFAPVLQHNDLGGWNIIVTHEGFVAVDWESSQRYGAPLWDLWYFLVHVLPLLANVADSALDAYLRRLLRGEDEWSALFFRWTRRAAAELGIPASRLGTLATLCWLHHAGSHPLRAASLAAHVPLEAPLALVTERLPRIWLTDEGLGPAWRCLEA